MNEQMNSIFNNILKIRDKAIVSLNPDNTRFREILIEGLRKRWSIIALLECEVFYEGRSSSYLGKGDRLLIIKRDRALIIHRPEGYKPVNWQPSNSSIAIEERDNILHLISIRESPYEKIIVKIYKPYIIAIMNMSDTAEFTLYQSEKAMQEILSKDLSIIEDGMRIVKREKEIKSGRIDILAKDREGNLVVIELKKGKIGIKEVLQLYRYVKELRESNNKVRGIIVGAAISGDALEMLKSLKLEYKILSLREFKSLKARVERNSGLGAF